MAMESEPICSSKDAELERLQRENDALRSELKDLLYIISHDLNAPLRSINSLSEWIVEDNQDRLEEAGRNQLGLLKTQVRKLSAMVQGVLELSRLGTEPCRLVAVNALEILESLAAKFRSDRISISVTCDQPPLLADPRRLHQLFESLLKNACSAIGEATGSISILGAKEGDIAVFEIRDSGCGMAAKDIERYFKIFQRGQSDNSDTSCGIGLPLVKKIVELHGGRISITSEPNGGSSVFVMLPLGQNRSES